MEHQSPQTFKSTQSFSAGTAAVYIFNLIVGTGALALPAAFAMAGWASATVLLLVLALLSYITASWVVETMAACNAILNIQTRLDSQQISQDEIDGDSQQQPEPNYFEEPDSDDGAYLVRNDMVGQVSLASYSYGSVNSRDTELFDLKKKIELAEMSNILYNKVGRLLFSICMIAYLYGDLAIYCTAVAKSLRDVSCTFSPANNTASITSSPCWATTESLSKSDMYKIFVALFIAVLGPFAYFNVTKTKYLQIVTSVMRWTAFITMITLAVMRIADGSVPHGAPPVVDITTTPMVFGVSVYAFMCHHSIPSLVTPVKRSSRVPAVLGADYVLIACFYLVLSYTGIFAFPSVPDLYTLAFKPEDSRGNLPLQIAGYFLALFPVFTLSTNFPIIATTLGNNLETIITETFPSANNISPKLKRVLFPSLAVLPPALVALATENLSVLVSVTGAYAGAGIQYFIPCSLVFLARKKLNHLRKEFNLELRNPLESYFRHLGFIVMIVVWSGGAVGLVTANFVLKAVKQ